MKKKYPEEKRRMKITITIDEKINEAFNEYVKDNGYYNKSEVIEDLIKKVITRNKKD